MIEFIIVLIIVIFVGYILERFLMSIFGYHIFRLLIIPGIFVHELSHTLVAKIFGAKIKKFEFLKADGGEVAYTKPVLPLLSQPAISLAPILGSSLILYFLGSKLGFNLQRLGQNFSLIDFGNLVAPLRLNITKSVILIYLVLSLTAAMTPSKKDLTNALRGLIALIILAGLIYYFYPASNQFFGHLASIYLFAVYVVILALIISFIFWTIKKLIFLSIGKR